MRQAVMVNPGEIEIVEVPKPTLSRGEGLVEIKNIGICGSDLSIYKGKIPFVQFPIVLGHEISGIVTDACECEKINVGDKVVIRPQKVCGTCTSCLNGNVHLCDSLEIYGVHINGFTSEYVAISEENLVVIPPDMPYDLSSLIEPLAVSVHAVNLAGDVSGKNVLVLGAGNIGNLVAQVAKAKGANVMIVGRTNYRLEHARQMGIDYCVNDHEEDLGDAVRNAFGNGADVTIECLGIDKAVDQAFTFCKKGGTAIITGVFGQKQSIDIFQLQDRELTVHGSMQFKEADFMEAISLIEEEKVKLAPLISSRFSLADYEKAFAYSLDRNNSVMKVVIDVS